MKSPVDSNTISTPDLPRQLRRIFDREDLELVLIDFDAVTGRGDVRLQVAENRVVFEQMGERRRTGQIVDGDDIDAGIPMAARMMLRPMRPNLLIPTLMAIQKLQYCPGRAASIRIRR